MSHFPYDKLLSRFVMSLAFSEEFWDRSPEKGTMGGLQGKKRAQPLKKLIQQQQSIPLQDLQLLSDLLHAQAPVCRKLWGHCGEGAVRQVWGATCIREDAVVLHRVPVQVPPPEDSGPMEPLAEGS